MRSLYWLVFLRVVLSFFILGTSHIIYAQKALYSHYGLIGGNVLITLLSAILIERFAAKRFYILFHVYWDFIFVTLLIYFTGGFFSLFSFMYILTIIFAAILTGQSHTMLVALTCSLAYSSLLVGHFAKLLTPLNIQFDDISQPTFTEIMVKILLNTLAFVITGILASHLSNLSRSADEQIIRQQKAMEELKILNENIVQSLPIGLITVDNKERVNFANAHAGPVLGIKSDLLMGMNLSDKIPSLAKLNPSKEPQDIELLHEDKSRRILAATVADLRDAGEKIIGQVVSLQDVTAIRELEDVAKQADRQAAIGRLAAGIAHEIRNPLASVSGSIQMLRSELELEPTHEHLMDIVTRETDRLNKLISDFLSYARPTKNLETTGDISEMLAEQLGVLENSPECQDRIQIVKNLQKGLTCRFDRDQIRQLFWNLFINAVQSMEGKSGTLTVTSRHSPRHPDHVEIGISDTGSGISQDIMNSIFDPFLTTKENGTGLGLTIAYRIVENHGGKIMVDSNPGGGTTFSILLPTKKPTKNHI